MYVLVFHADSYNLRYAAHQFAACANEMRGQAKRYGNSAQHLLQYWKGDAAQTFCQVHEQMAQDMQQLAGALERTASELQTLANRNDHVQELKRQAQQVEWQLQSLNSSDPNYESEAHYYRQRAHDLYYAAEMEALADDERAAFAFREIESVMNSLFLPAVQNHSSASASATPKVHPWWEKAMDFVSGAVYSVASSSSWGLLEWAVDDEADLRSDEYMEGKIFGDYLSTGIGVVTALDGLLVAAGGAAGGVLLSWTGVGAVAGAGVAVAGVAEAGYGAGIAFKGYSNLQKDQSLMEARKSQSEAAASGEQSKKGADEVGVPPRYGDRKISDELYDELRDETPTAELRAKVNEGVTLPMPDPALPGMTITKNLEADHIVPMKNIVRMDGFERLSYQQQVEVLNNPENFIGLSKTANTSKGSKTFAEWTIYKKENIPVAPEFRMKMIEIEKVMERKLQKQIDDMLKGIKP